MSKLAKSLAAASMALIAGAGGSVRPAAALQAEPKASATAATANTLPPPVQLTADQDHKRLTAPPVTVASGASRTKVALTFDDLPAHGPLPAGADRVEIAKSLIAALKAANVPPVYGFVNVRLSGEGPEMREVLTLWRDAGFLLGNHTSSHMDLDANTAAAFIADVRADEPTLKSLMGEKDWHWLRYPYLHRGDTPEKREAVAAFLRENGYKVAAVTLTFDDWAYSDPYARCVARSDQQAIDWLKRSYLSRASASLDPARSAARHAYGREVPLVLLLHAGAFQAFTLPGVLDLLKQSGFDLVSLDQAESDPAYVADRDSVTGAPQTKLDELLAAQRAAADDTRSKLDRLCR